MKRYISLSYEKERGEIYEERAREERELHEGWSSHCCHPLGGRNGEIKKRQEKTKRKRK